MKMHIPLIKKLSVSLAIGLILPALARAATVTMTANDTSSIQSYKTAGYWSDGLAPSAANDYVVNGKQLRGPSSSGTWAFGGNSITLSNNAYLIGVAVNGETLRMDNLTLAGGVITNWSSTAVGTLTITGTTKLGSGANAFRLSNGKNGFTIASVVTGTGSVALTTDATTTGTAAVTMSGSNNYSGGTTINSYTNLVGTHDDVFGVGDVKVLGGTLTMTLGTTNDYIDDTATLYLASGLLAGSIILNYTGADNIARLSFDGGTTFAASGTWGAVGSGAEYESSLFTGAGYIDVVPEPSSIALILLGSMASIALMKNRYFRS